jgi:hypothetical protein
MCLNGICFLKAASETSSATGGIMVDKPLKNARVLKLQRNGNSKGRSAPGSFK